MAKVSIVTEDNKVLEVTDMDYGSLEDTAGEINGGDFWSLLSEQHPGVSFKEVRITLDEPMSVDEGEFDEENEEDDE